MKKIILIIFIMFILFSKNTTFSKEMIPDEAIRLRVLANSNSDYDQKIKNIVSSNIQKQMYSLLKDTDNIESARNTIITNMKSIDNNVNLTLKENNYDLGYEVDYGMHDFPEKEYNGVVYEEGKYESLLVKLGSGEGNNWWCVLFPPLCLLEAEETNKEKVEYKSFILELIDKIF